MVIFTGLRAKPEMVRNSSTSPRSVVSAIGPWHVAAGCVTFGSCFVIGFGRVTPWNAGIFCQKWLSMAFGGACRLWVRRCASPPVITSIPATSCSKIEACIVRNCASAISAGDSWPIMTSRSSGSYHRGTLYAPITVVVYFAYRGIVIPLIALLGPSERVRSYRRADDSLSGCRYPSGFGLVVHEPRGGLQSVLGCVQDQVPFIVFLTRVEGAEGNRNILFAHPEESADANDQGRNTTFLVDQDVIDLADLIVRRIVNVLLVEVGHGGPGRQPGKDLSRPRSHCRGLLRDGRSTDADCKCDSWDDLSHDASAPVDRMSIHPPD